MEFTKEQLKSIREMTLAIWCVEFDRMRLHETRNDSAVIHVPIYDQKVKWYETDELHKMQTPQFKQERIELDRWLLPWKLKAGYGPASNLLVYRWNDNTTPA